MKTIDVPLLTMEQVLDYEIHVSWWAGLAFGTFLQGLAGDYFAWKVVRKYRRYLESKRASVLAHLLTTVGGQKNANSH